MQSDLGKIYDASEMRMRARKSPDQMGSPRGNKSYNDYSMDFKGSRNRHEKPITDKINVDRARFPSPSGNPEISINQTNNSVNFKGNLIEENTRDKKDGVADVLFDKNV